MYIYKIMRVYILSTNTNHATKQYMRVFILRSSQRSVLLKRVAQATRFVAAKRKPVPYQLLIKLNL